MELKRLWEMKSEIDDIQKKLEEVQDALKHIVPTLDGLPKSQNVDDRIGHLITTKIELENKLAELEIEQKMTEAELTATIALSELNRNEREVMRRRYISLQTFSAIAKEMRYSENNVYWIHRQGVRKLTPSP